jgi:EmrB/QacA subfamily drug resistance transporter
LSVKNANLSRHADNKWVVLALVALAQFMVVLDVAIVNVALPSIARDLNFSPNNLQWVITAYTLTFGGFLLLGGRAADLYGRRKLFIGAVSAFALFSLLCGLAQSEAMLIVMRGLQGLAGAIMTPVALSIVLTEFSEGKERNKALGIWGAVAAGGAAAGVLIGGILTQYLNWRWNFFVNVPVSILVVAAAMRLLPHHIGEENKKVKLDLPGTLLAITGLMSVVYGLSRAPALGWDSSTVWGFLGLGAALLVVFTLVERRSEQPLLPMALFKIRNVLGGNVAFLAIACSMFAMFFFLTLYLQQVLGYSPVKTGLCFLPVTIIVGITSGVVSNLVGKIGYKPPMVAGPLMLATGLFILSHILKVGGGYWQNVFPGLSVAAIGMGLTFVSGTLAATSGVPKHFSGIASGVLSTSQQIGGALGLAILSAVAFSTVASDLVSGYQPLAAQVHGYTTGLTVGMFLALGAVVAVLVLVKNQKVDAKKAMAETAA